MRRIDGSATPYLSQFEWRTSLMRNNIFVEDDDCILETISVAHTHWSQWTLFNDFKGISSYYWIFYDLMRLVKSSEMLIFIYQLRLNDFSERQKKTIPIWVIDEIHLTGSQFPRNPPRQNMFTLAFEISRYRARDYNKQQKQQKSTANDLRTRLSVCVKWREKNIEKQ